MLNTFSYCFKDSFDYPATLKMNSLKKSHKYFDNNQFINIEAVSVQHGMIKSLAYIINNKCAYASDVSKIYKKDLKYFLNLKYFIVDCLRFEKHYSHFNLNEVLNLIKIIKPKKTLLTNLNNQMDYSKLKKTLPNNVMPAYDGLTLSI